MPSPKFLGDRPAVTGDRQVPSLPTSKSAAPPLQVDRFARNGKVPDATFFNKMNAGANAAMCFRTKDVFGMGTILGQAAGLPVSSTVGTRARFRFAFHTSPYSHALFCRAIMYPQTSGYTSDAYSKLVIYSDAGETTAVATAEFHYGANPLQSAVISGWQYLRVVDKFIEGLTADTDYYARVSDVDYGLIQSISVADLQSMATNYSGYLPQNFTSESQILDEYRANLVGPLKSLWNRGGAKVWNWSVDNQSAPTTIAVNTATNVIDSTSTTYGDAIPGPTLIMTGKARLSQSSGVPCVMKTYMACSSASNGVVNLRDSTGAVVATCTNNLGAGVGSWISSGAFNLPATSGKYYLTHQTAAGTLSTYASTIYEYET